MSKNVHKFTPDYSTQDETIDFLTPLTNQNFSRIVETCADDIGSDISSCNEHVSEPSVMNMDSLPRTEAITDPLFVDDEPKSNGV